MSFEPGCICDPGKDHTAPCPLTPGRCEGTDLAGPPGGWWFIPLRCGMPLPCAKHPAQSPEGGTAK